MPGVTGSYEFAVERGPNCLFVRLTTWNSITEAADLAETLWNLLDQHLTYRLVLELDEVEVLRSFLIGQLVLLHKRICQHGGMLRLCGLSPRNHEALKIARLADRFPAYQNRNDAVRGAYLPYPTKPR